MALRSRIVAVSTGTLSDLYKVSRSSAGIEARCMGLVTRRTAAHRVIVPRTGRSGNHTYGRYPVLLQPRLGHLILFHLENLPYPRLLACVPLDDVLVCGSTTMAFYPMTMTARWLIVVRLWWYHSDSA